MIVTIRSDNGFYKSVEYNEFRKDWVNFFDNLKTKIDFRFEKNTNMYLDSNKDVIKDTLAPTLKVLKGNTKLY